VYKAFEFTIPPQLINLLVEIVGAGSLITEGQEHRVQRKNLMPAFEFPYLKELSEISWAKSKDLASAVKPMVENIFGDLWEFMPYRCQRLSK